jgi:hypothetical protein
MTNVQFQITGDGFGGETLTFINADGGFVTINSANPGYEAARAAVLAGDVETAVTNSVPLTSITARLRSVDPRFDSDGTMVTFDGRRLSLRLSETLIGMARRQDAGIKALAKFIILLDQNPSAHSVNQLFDWIDTAGLVLSEEGHIVAYKGVQRDASGDYRSVSSGWGFVNGNAVKGRLRNNVGDVVSMKRNEVTDDPSIGCHQGLHAGSYEYASTFGPHLLTVKINPCDVVSVPTDCNAQKMRVSRYEVIGVNPNKVKFDNYSVYDGDFDDDDDEDDWF